MTIDANWVAALGSVASAVIVAVTATAAFMQIRHARNSNEILVFMRVVERIDSLDAAAAFGGVDSFAERVKRDRAFRERLTQQGPPDDFREIASLLQFLEHFCTLIVTGLVTEDLILAEYADNMIRLWDRLAEAIYIRRTTQPHYCAAFEHLAMRARAYLTSGAMERFYSRLERDPAMSGRRTDG